GMRAADGGRRRVRPPRPRRSHHRRRRSLSRQGARASHRGQAGDRNPREAEPQRLGGGGDRQHPHRPQHRLKLINDQPADQTREPAMSPPTPELVARLADAFEFMMDGKAEASPLAALQDAVETAEAPSIAECVPLMAITLELIARGPTTISIEG